MSWLSSTHVEPFCPSLLFNAVCFSGIDETAIPLKYFNLPSAVFSCFCCSLCLKGGRLHYQQYHHLPKTVFYSSFPFSLHSSCSIWLTRPNHIAEKCIFIPHMKVTWFKMWFVHSRKIPHLLHIVLWRDECCSLSHLLLSKMWGHSGQLFNSSEDSQMTVHAHICTYGQFKVTVSPQRCVSGLWISCWREPTPTWGERAINKLQREKPTGRVQSGTFVMETMLDWSLLNYCRRERCARWSC